MLRYPDMFESLLKKWDGEQVIVRYDQPTSAWIFIAIHSTRFGPTDGGTRLKSYAKVQDAMQDAMRLSKGMTYKFAIAGLPRGGGKAVIAIPPDFDRQDRPALLRRFGSMVHQLGGLFTTAPDVGLSPTDMDIINETGRPYVYGCTSDPRGTGSPGSFAALSVFTGMQVTCQQCFGIADLKGRRVLVQGAGSVGDPLIQYLRAAGAVVMFSETNEKCIRHFRDKLGLEFVEDEEIYTTACDIFAPCAIGDVLNRNTIPQLNCRAVVGGANNQLARTRDADLLHARGILYAPDYVVNLGAAMADIGTDIHGWTKEQARQEVVERVKSVLRQVFALASIKGLTPEVAARYIAEECLSKGR